jgi:DNA-binding CsgD family transcriptional regulator
VNLQKAIEELSAIALHSQSRDEYRRVLLGKIIELLGLEAGLLWHTDGVSSSLARPPGIKDELETDFTGYVSEFTRTEIEVLQNAKSLSDTELFSDARREQLSLYNRYLRPNRIRGFVSRAWVHGDSFHIVGFCKNSHSQDYELEKSSLDMLFPVIALGDALTSRKSRSGTRTDLSLRERQVLNSASKGRTNKEIAHELGIAHSTVRVLLARASHKLRARTRDEVIAAFAERCR